MKEKKIKDTELTILQRLGWVISVIVICPLIIAMAMSMTWVIYWIFTGRNMMSDFMSFSDKYFNPYNP